MLSLIVHLFDEIVSTLQKKPDWSKKGGEGEKKVKDGEDGDSGAEDVKA